MVPSILGLFYVCIVNYCYRRVFPDFVAIILYLYCAKLGESLNLMIMHDSLLPHWREVPSVKNYCLGGTCVV